jgi:hemerythrin-like domain-containing protein
MHRLLQDLHQDHINFSRVLKFLENQLDILRDSGPANLHALNEVVDYVGSYPDLIHHPREDVIFSVYLEKRAEGGNPEIEGLMEEHQRIIDSTAELATAMQQWLCDSPVPRERLVDLFADYLRMQWDHLNLEERTIYKLLDEALGGEDWAHIESIMPQGSDPLFHDQMRRRYQNIFDHVIVAAG